MIRVGLTSCAVILLASSCAWGQTIRTIDFEVPFGKADDFTISGVTFDFKIAGSDSAEAFVGSFGPGALSAVSDPSMTGDSTGILTLLFDWPTPTLGFGVALSTADSLSPGFTVELFSPSDQSLGIESVDTVSVGGEIAFSQATFVHSGDPVSRAVIDFADAPGNFAFDNLTFAIPEPSAAPLLIAGLMCCLIYCRRTRKCGLPNLCSTAPSES